MQHLIQCRAAYAKTGKPMPKLLCLLSDSESESDSEETALQTTTSRTTETTTTAGTTNRRLLNVNASEFVPRTKEDNDLHPVERKSTQPKLLLPWKGFPKQPRAERPAQQTLPAIDKETLPLNAEFVGKKPPREKIEVEETPADVKRREQERKVALEALKLVEQRRQREQQQLEEKKPEVLVHLTREAVNFTAEERVRVDKLRAIKKEQIERILNEMRQELEQKLDRQLQQQQLDQKLPSQKPVEKPPKTQQQRGTAGRYVALQRAVKQPEEKAQPELTIELKTGPMIELKSTLQIGQTIELKAGQQLEISTENKSEPARRYIPTVKQWDERCKARAVSANKENYTMRKPLGKSDENMLMQRAMAPSTLGNIMQASKEIKETLPKASKDQGLFVPRYWPPAPKVASGEKRRGNLTHARNISRAFANCGLLPTPTIPGVTLAPDLAEKFEYIAAKSSVKRYDIKRLLELEPQPEQLEIPFIRINIRQLGFLCD
ncbi:golgin subfamily A member 6-like protein 22 [Drosophila sulfurigaster albostrigata]|uniref:golgin subfamily A member 6-like protein 22 n=1 Tax=Drosophila sulfurigaster albostrigata TaxID=89887 RepID=UPI002D21BB5A|nr:golgin subfamily A member 6-like protein 22 [Drosophila sulfurigaster albostrigata]